MRKHPVWTAIAAACLCLLALCVIYADTLQRGLGWSSQATKEYAAWSSSIPALIAAATGSTVLGSLWHVFNCHVDGCPRLGRYHVAGGHYRVCRTHHPEAEVRGGLSVHHIHAAHHAHMLRRDT